MQLHEQGITVSTSFVACIFWGWQWSWQKPCVQQLQKYTPLNICYYTQFILIIPCLPPIWLKFLDKVHFISQHLQHNCIISPTGSTPFLHTTSEISNSFSLTLLTDLSDPNIPFFINMQANLNMEWDYASFISVALAAGWLLPGNFLFVNNASIHFGAKTQPFLCEMLNNTGVHYIFLPTYSPKLNHASWSLPMSSTSSVHSELQPALYHSLLWTLSHLSHTPLLSPFIATASIFRTAPLSRNKHFHKNKTLSQEQNKTSLLSVTVSIGCACRCGGRTKQP
jgi:hypothetical protein